MIIDIQKNHPDLSGFRFCKKIMLQYAPYKRTHTTHLLISDGKCVSTDGKRIHLFEHDGLYGDGLYLVSICRINLVQIIKTDRPIKEFPKYESLISTNKYYKLDAGYSMGGPNLSGTVFAINNTGACVNPQFISDLGSDEYFDVFITKEKDKIGHKPIILKSGKKLAALMPMRI